ncbi:MULTISPECIES: T9SS type A sorting domain-containing protein [Flavobacterium]|nr:T9SS type A sorting domain-containing protein [Flavobacterium sp. N1846]
MKKLLLKRFMTITRIIAICLFSSLGWAQTPPPTTLFPNQVYAGNATTVGQLNVSSSGSLKFYTVANGGTAIPISTLLVDNTTYYLSQTVSGVESTSRVSIKVRRISESTQTLTGVNTVANLVSTPSSGSTARWFNVAGGGSPLPSITVLATGNYYVDQIIPAGVATLASGFNMPYGLAIESDGKILLSEANGGVIKRMNADGTNSTNLITGLNGPYAIALQTDGKIVFAESGAGVTPTAIKRANANGTGIQTLYTGDASQEFFAVAIQADGKIIFSDQNYVYRINSDGTGITTLTNAGDVLGPQGLFVQSDGKILIADSFNGAVKRMDADGTNLTTLISGLSFPRTIASLSSGKLVISELMGGKITTYNSDGTNPVIIGNTTNFTNPSGIGVITDGKILVTDTDSNTLKLIYEESNTNRALVGVTIIPSPPTTTWTKQIYAGAKTISDLQVTGTNVKWYSTSTGGTALDTSTLLVSGNTYYATQTISAIESTSRLAVTVNKISEASQIVNNGSTIANLTTTPSVGATAQWFSNASGGTALSSSQSISSGVLYVEENASGVTSNRVSVVISIAPAAPTTLYPTQIYKGDTNNLTSLQATGTGVKWYTTPTGGTALANTTLLTDNTTYYASQTVSFVESLTRTPVTVKRISNATQSVPYGSTFANLITTPSPSATIEWFSVATGGTALASNTTLANATYYIQQTLSGVVSNRISIPVTLTCVAPVVNTQPNNAIACNLSNTSFTVATTGATAYQWQVNTGAGFTDITNGSLYSNATTSTLNITGATTTMNGYLYRCVLINGAAACFTNSNSATLTVSNPTLTPLSQTNVACNGGNSGAATVNVATGGVGPYTYDWTPGNPSGDGTRTVTGLTAGLWTCTVTDANGCTATRNFTITQPSALALNPSSQTNVACNGGSNGAATVNVATGGAGGYTYDWTPGNPTGDGTRTVTGLTAGLWTCTVTDANGCTTSRNFTITQPTAIVATAASQTNVTCNGDNNGAASINTPTGGVGGYTYNWTPGNPTGDGTTSVTNLSAGTWTCTVTDANGCITSVNFTITEPTPLLVTAGSITDVSCNGGADGAASITTPTGGVGGYTYNWLPGNPTGDGTTSVTGLTAGTWTCIVTDANGCSTLQNFSIAEPMAVNSNVTQTLGILTANQNGATYQWFSCPNTLLTGETNQSYTPTVAGDYKVQVTVAGCTVTSSCVTVTTLGSAAFDLFTNFKMYPNPTNGRVNIDTDTDGDVAIVNQLGQTVATMRMKANVTNTINIDHLSEGTYFVKGINGTNIATQRLILKK